MIVLEFRAGPNAGQRVALQRTTVRIGGPGCNIVIVDPAVSNPHCEIRVRDGQYELIDLGSASGTRFNAPNAPPLRPRTVYAVDVGTIIWLGDTALELSAVQSDRTAKMEPAERPRAAAGVAMAERTMRMRKVDRAPRERADTELSIPIQSEDSEPDLGQRAHATDAVVLDAPGDDDDPAAIDAPYEKQARLTFTSGPHVGRRVFLGQSEITIGRSDENVVVLQDPRVELRHAVISRGPGGRYQITPRVDRAVVRVNSERVTQAQALDNGDVLAVGASDASFTEAGIDMEAPDAASTIAVQEPIFAYHGQARRQLMLTIGRSPDVDLFLDHHRVERSHARVVFRYPDFYLEDLSSSGTYVGGERVADRLLENGDEARVGSYRIRFQIQPLRCSLELIPPENDEEIPRFAADVDAAASYQTLYHLPANLGGAAAERLATKNTREAKDRAAVLWVEPHDVKRTWRTAIMAVIATVMSLGVVGFLALDGGETFLRRPLSEGHRSPAFVKDLTAKANGADSCRACHGQFESRVTRACTTCHAEDAHPLRPKHQSVTLLMARACTGCHTEHQTEDGAPLLVDGALCAAAGCHVTRHANFFPQTKGPTTRTPTTARTLARRETFGIDLVADLALDRAKRKTKVHQVHLAAGLEGQCGACHSVGGQERPTGAAWQSCFTCHGPRSAEEAMGSLKCSECHREHGDDAQWASAVGKAGALSAGGVSQVAFLLLLLPVGLFFALHHVVISRKKFLAPGELPAEAKTGASEEMLCDGLSTAESKKLPRLISSKCVGSADCVAICPYQVLEMAPGKPPKPVVARPELCHECGLCVARCGPGALVMMAPEEPFPLVDRPAVDANFELSIPGAKGGVYVIGAAAAKPSVKNGINLGYWVVQHAAFEGAFAGAAARLRIDYELIIIGAGPAGLSAGLAAAELGLNYVILERSDTYAGAVRAYPVGKPVQVNPPHPEDPERPQPDDVSMVGYLWLERDAVREDLLERWSPQAGSMNIRYGERVDAMRAENSGFVVVTQTRTYSALKVVVAVGDRGSPRRLAVPGETLPKVKHQLDDARGYAGKHVMVVGGGNSAVEAAVSLARDGACATVRLVYRKKVFNRATPKNRAELQAQVDAGRLKLHLEISPREVKEASVILGGPNPREVANDIVFALLGWDLPTAWMRKLGIEITKKPADWEPGPSDKPAFLQLGEGGS